MLKIPCFLKDLFIWKDDMPEKKGERREGKRDYSRNVYLVSCVVKESIHLQKLPILSEVQYQGAGSKVK